MEDKFDDKNLSGSMSYLLDWVSNHKIFTIFLLVLLILGFDKVVRHMTKRWNF